MRATALGACLPVMAACSATTPRLPASTAATNPPTAAAIPPAWMLGQFEDDYGGSFRVTPQELVQLPRGRFRIVQWNIAGQYFIAQNDSLNRSDPGKWTRIDWMPLDGMAPYRWAFCFSAWNAATRALAESAPSANRTVPRTGCAGFPFTRMKPAG
ncbi:MAG: hypothetical protein ACO1Q7_03370 [Gemmatimonas sp.]